MGKMNRQEQDVAAAMIDEVAKRLATTSRPSLDELAESFSLACERCDFHPAAESASRILTEVLLEIATKASLIEKLQK
jgi:hypothetical protein